MISRWIRLSALALGLVAVAGPVGAQLPGVLARPAETNAPAVADLPVDIEADSLEYLADRKLIVGTGNVIVREGGDLLQADYVTVKTDTRDVYARGNVLLRRGADVWQGDEMNYNLKTKEGDFGQFNAFVDPIHIRADSSRKMGENEVELKNVLITTCDGEDPDYSLRAREARLVNGERLKAKGVMLYYGAVPVMWMPRLERNLGKHERFWQFVPGFSSRNGAYLLSAYNYPVAKNVRGVTHIDPYSKKGVGLGQDFLWKSTNNVSWRGAFRSYYIDDQEPFRSDEEREREQELVDNERWRLKLEHNATLSDRDSFFSEVNYVSDPEMIKDFFDEEFRRSVQPENQVALTHRGDNFTAGLLLNKRLNDFFSNVDRLPELTLDAQQQPLGESGLFYQSQNSAAFLDRVFEESSDEEDYDAFRIDSGHLVSYPGKYLGFLTLTPRAGYRATYYSTTIGTETVTNTIVQTDTNGIVSVTNEVTDIRSDLGADLRNVYELGLSASFKAFRAWDDLIVLGDGDGLRHVVEPYAIHTFIPEPNLTPEDLPQFDDVDEVDERHDIRLGLRNKLQTRRPASYSMAPLTNLYGSGVALPDVVSEQRPATMPNYRVVDLVDANVYTFYRIEKEEDQEDFTDIFFDVSLRLAQRFPIDFDGRYDAYEGEFRTFNSEIAYIFNDMTSLSAEYRYKRDDQNQYALQAVLFPNARWSFQAYGRWDTENDGLQEQAYFIQRRSRCLGYGLGVRHIPNYDGEDDDYRVWAQIWILAFPQTQPGIGG